MIEAAAMSDDPAGCLRYNTQKMLEQGTALEGEAAVRACEESVRDDPQLPDRVTVSQVEVDGERATADVAFDGAVYDGQTIASGFVEEEGVWKLDEAIRFVVLDREKLLLAWGRALYRQAENQAEARAAGCVVAQAEEFDDDALEELFLEPSPEVLLRLAQTCEPRSAAV